MKTTLLLCGALGLIAVSTVTESMIVQGGALGILGYTVWYLLTKALPQERKDFLKALEAQRLEFLEQLKGNDTDE